MYLFLAVLRLCCCLGFSPVVASGGRSSLKCMYFSLQWLLFLGRTGSGHVGSLGGAPWL